MGRPTIDQVLPEFLAEQQRRLSGRTFRRYADVVELLRACLNGYGYLSLPETDRARWEAAFDAGDEEAFCRLFGPEQRGSRLDPTPLAAGDYIDDCLEIEWVQSGALWFADGIGPVAVPAKASKLAQPGWSVTVVLGRSGERWQLL